MLIFSGLLLVPAQLWRFLISSYCGKCTFKVPPLFGIDLESRMTAVTGSRRRWWRGRLYLGVLCVNRVT